jgi:hypothetical protein
LPWFFALFRLRQYQKMNWKDAGPRIRAIRGPAIQASIFTCSCFRSSSCCPPCRGTSDRSGDAAEDIADWSAMTDVQDWEVRLLVVSGCNIRLLVGSGSDVRVSVGFDCDVWVTIEPDCDVWVLVDSDCDVCDLIGSGCDIRVVVVSGICGVMDDDNTDV